MERTRYMHGLASTNMDVSVASLKTNIRGHLVGNTTLQAFVFIIFSALCKTAGTYMGGIREMHCWSRVSLLMQSPLSFSGRSPRVSTCKAPLDCLATKRLRKHKKPGPLACNICHKFFIARSILLPGAVLVLVLSFASALPICLGTVNFSFWLPLHPLRIFVHSWALSTAVWISRVVISVVICVSGFIYFFVLKHGDSSQGRCDLIWYFCGVLIFFNWLVVFFYLSEWLMHMIFFIEVGMRLRWFLSASPLACNF